MQIASLVPNFFMYTEDPEDEVGKVPNFVEL